MNWVFAKTPEKNIIHQLKADLEKLDSPQRRKLRDDITLEIINDISDKLVILSGPGTGKSHIFVNKIKSVLNINPDAKILVTTFVNKLAKELSEKIQSDSELQSKKNQISSRTLHAIAYEIMKTSTSFKNHSQLLFSNISEEIWIDIMEICGADSEIYSYIDFQHQTHDLNYKSECLANPMWKKLHEMYIEMVHLYKALSFDDHVKLAYEGICSGEIKCPKYDFIIIDEYQDFNKCVKELINVMIANSKLSLFAGDDDQVPVPRHGAPAAVGRGHALVRLGRRGLDHIGRGIEAPVAPVVGEGQLARLGVEL